MLSSRSLLEATSWIVSKFGFLDAFPRLIAGGGPSSIVCVSVISSAADVRLTLPFPLVGSDTLAASLESLSKT